MVDVIIRCDASRRLGSGHVKRCLTLAGALRQRGCSCEFVTTQLDGNLNDEIQENGFHVNVLPPNISPLSEVNPQDRSIAKCSDDLQELDALETVKFFDMRKPVVIVDNYELDFVWETIVRKMARSIVAIDDMTERSHDCDILINQNLGFSSADYKGLVDKDCLVFAGSKYCLIPADFLQARNKQLRNKSKSSPKVLINFGGSDLENNISRALLSIASTNPPLKLDEICVVLGPQNQRFKDVAKIADTLPFSTTVIQSVPSMATLMSEASLAIGAAGSSTWERCCVGLPALQCILADNQKQIANQAQTAGVAETFSFDALSLMLKFFFNTKEGQRSLNRMSKKAAKLVDGKGLQRLVPAIIGG